MKQKKILDFVVNIVVDQKLVVLVQVNFGIVKKDNKRKIKQLVILMEINGINIQINMGIFINVKEVMN